VQANDIKKTALSFIGDKNADPKDTSRIITEKTELLAKHYDLSDTIGHHGEDLVFKVVKDLGYTEVEIRKEKHGLEELGIAKRDIDVFGKRPAGDCYQNIEVKNRRDPVHEPELTTIMTTTATASSKWNLTIKPALVATFARKTTVNTAKAIDMPVAYSGGVYVPEKHRTLYEELNRKVALNVTITDAPSDILRKNIKTYISEHKYK
jgi:hypothetical protein